MSTRPKKIGLCHAWREDGEEFLLTAIDSAAAALRKADLDVVHERARSRQAEVLLQLARGNVDAEIICVLVTSAFLRSEECLSEMLQLFAVAKDPKQKFSIWTLCEPGQLIEWEKALEYWRDKRRDAAQDAKKLAPNKVPSHERIERIGGEADNLLAFLQSAAEPYSELDFCARISGSAAARASTRDEMLEQVYANVLHEMGTLLLGNRRLKDFVRAGVPALIVADPSTKFLSTTVRMRNFDLAHSLKSVKAAVPQYGVSKDDVSDLEAFVGGMVVLGIDPGWVTTQRAILSAGSIEYPGLTDFVPLGRGQRANFLHIVAAALVDGCARLSRVFGDPEEDRWMSVPKRFRSLEKFDRQREIKLHLIRFVLGPTVNVDEANEVEIDHFFARVRNVLNYARHEAREPYSAVGSGEDFKRMVVMLREELNVPDLILLQPRGTGSEDELMQDVVAVLSHLSAIWKVLNARRAQLP